MVFTYVAFGIALFFAMNIGASGAAASMGIAYGAGAIKRKQLALLLSGLGVFLGAMIGGGEVVKTIGSGIIPPSIISVKIAIIILASATISLFIANLLGIPLSTSEVTVGSVVGVGIAFQSLYTFKLLSVVIWWVLTPIVAFLFAFVVGKLIFSLERKFPTLKGKKWSRLLTVLIIAMGFFEAFSAGMNNVANAVGPLVGAGMISVSAGTIIGGLFVALGASLLGGRVVETNGKKITHLSLLEGSAVSGTGAALVTIASIFGVPVPLTQITTCGILGVGTSKNGFHIWQKGVIKQMMKVWLVSPVFSLAISYGLVKLLLDSDFYTVVAITSVFLATIGSMSLLQSTRKEKSSIHEQGGGI